VSGGADTRLDNNRAVDITPVLGLIDLAVAKSHTGEFVRGGTGVFQIVVSNVSQEPSSGQITLTDSLPTGLIQKTVAGQGWSCQVNGQTVICARSDALSPGASYPAISLEVNIALNAPSQLTNEASISGGNDANAANNIARDQVLIRDPGKPRLVVRKTHSAGMVPGGTGQFFITVQNSGDGPTSGPVTVVDDMAAAFKPLSASGNGWSCTIQGQKVSCSRSDVLSPGASYPELALSVAIDPKAPTNLRNIATVGCTGDCDKEPGTDDIILDPAPVLQISKGVDRPFAEIGDVLFYRIEIQNLSATQPIRDIVLKDRLPIGFVYISGTAQVQSGVNSAVAIEPEIQGNQLRFVLGNLPGLGRFSVRYRVRIGAKVQPGEQINYAQATGRSPADALVASVEVSARVRIGQGVFTMRQFVIGRVFEDANGNGDFDKGERPVAGARVFLTNGQSASTDSEGMYNIPAVGEGTVVISLDPVTLPANYGLADGGRRDGDSFTRLLRTPLGSGAMLRQNFPIRPIRRETEARAEGYYKSRKQVEYKPDDPKRPMPPEEVPATAAAPVSPVISTITTLRPVARSRGPLQKLELVLDKRTIQAGGRESALLTVRGIDAAGNSSQDGFVMLETTAGQFLVQREGSCLAGDNSPRCAGAAGRGQAGRQMPTGSISGAPSGRTAGGVPATADGIGPALRPLQTGTIHTGVGLIGSGAEFSLGQTSEQIADNLQQIRLELRGGEASIRLLAAGTPGKAEIRASAGLVESRAAIEFAPGIRPPILVGLGEVSFGRAAPEFAPFGHSKDIFGRAEFLYQNTLPGNSLLTLAYSSARPLNRSTDTDRMFQTDPIDRLYPVFGDSSTRHELAQSNSRFYARLEKGRSFVLFGDMRNDIASPQRSGLAGFERNLTGVKAHVEGKDGSYLTLSGARPETSFARDVFPGFAFGLIRLSHPDVLQGSETVTIETRDRRNPELVVSREPMIRDVDYTLDGTTGSLFFLRSLSGLDSVLNLIQVVVTYEFRTSGTASAIYQAKASKEFSRLGLKLGGSFMRQNEDATGAYYLGNFELTQKLWQNGSLSVDVPVSHGNILTAGSYFSADSLQRDRNGFAMKAELDQPINLRSKSFGQARIRLSLLKTEQDFLNPYGSTTVPGAQRASGSFESSVGQNSRIQLAVADERNNTANVDNNRQTYSVMWSQTLEQRVDFTLGYDYRRLEDTRKNEQINSNLVTAGLDARVTSRLQVGVRREQNMSDADPTYPNQTVLTARYRLSDATRFFFTQRLASAPIQPIGDLSAAGFAAIHSRRETSLGVETRWKRYTSLGTRYQMENGLNGTDGFAVLGLVTRIPVRERASFDVGLERGILVSGSGDSFTSANTGMTWQPGNNFRVSGRYELRDRNGFGNIFTAGAAGRLSRGVSTLGTLQYARSRFDGQRNQTLQGTAALAIRPVESDRAGLLFSYTLRDAEGGSWWGVPTDRHSRVGVLSTDAFVEPLRGLEIFGRFALSDRSSGSTDNSLISTLTYLWQGRMQLRFLRYFDAAGEIRYLYQPVTDSRRRSSGAELGGWPLRDLRLGVGYSFSSDADLGRSFLTREVRRGWYFTISSKASRLFNVFGTPDDKLESRRDR
jgi:uncharacterized repeat protein (TIGR01451 family)